MANFLVWCVWVAAAFACVSSALAVVSFDGKNLKVTGQVKVTGGPDGIRTSGR